MKKIEVLIAIGAAVWFLAACGSNTATPTAVSQVNTPTAPIATDTAVTTAAPTDTIVPTTTPTQVPTVEPTATTTTPTPKPTETPTTEPTDTPTPKPTAIATSQPTVTSIQSSATPTTAVPVSAPVAPPPAPAPAGPNLLANPGFEDGKSGWLRVTNIQSGAGNARFIHSGERSAMFSASQLIMNMVPGTTYRAGAWVIIWSSTGEDRSVSENPGDVFVTICIDTDGHEDGGSPPMVCSASTRPLDNWQYISVDAVAINDRIKVHLTLSAYGPYLPLHNEIYWDDAALGLAPVMATATPLPTLPPSRPAPVPFSAPTLRDNMNFVRSQIEQMGGVLDRMYNGEPGKCSEYLGYYNAVLTSPTYDGIPVEWQIIYNDYIFAVENTLATNDALKGLCNAGGGQVTQHNYGVGRQGINISLDRLIPAIEAANALSGG